mmetsp:Transcript_20603/g.25282  ORF Transcript_20603/g.25282 Transcript_20603/m.25282 type:complete len:353 (-) Transcript_20603:39-1097(-)
MASSNSLIKTSTQHVCDYCQSLSTEPSYKTSLPLPNQSQSIVNLKRCSRCHLVRYCSIRCQKAHWKAGHKAVCLPTSIKAPTLSPTQNPHVRLLPPSFTNLLQEKKNYIFVNSADLYDTNLLILLHGAGDSSLPFSKFATKLALPQTTTLAISAQLFEKLPFELGFTYFNEMDYNTGHKLQCSDPKRMKSLQNAVEKLSKMIRTLSEVWIPERIFLFGFSNGACLAMETALSWSYNRIDSIVLGGAICVAGGIRYLEENKDAKLTRTNSASPILLLVGAKDVNFSPSMAALSSQLYASHTTKEDLVTIDITKHKISSESSMINSKEEVQALMTFLSDKLVRLIKPQKNWIEL